MSLDRNYWALLAVGCDWAAELESQLDPELMIAIAAFLLNDSKKLSASKREEPL